MRLGQAANFRPGAGPRVAIVMRGMDLDMLVARVLADFREFPGMQLTARQAQRLWAVDDHLLEVLVHRGVLRRQSNGTISHSRAAAYPFGLNR